MKDSHKRDKIDSRASKDARDWVVRLSSGGVSAAELARFKAWRDASAEHEEAFAREKIFWRQLDVLDPQGASGWHRMPTAMQNRRRFIIGGSAVAAAAGISIIAAPQIKLLWEADYRTAPGEQTNVALPDGSRATLNTDSALAFRFRSGLRKVELLQGEALFDVKLDRDVPFRVAALNGNSDTFGASFAVRMVAERVSIVVAKGEVSVVASSTGDELGRTSSTQIVTDQQTHYARGSIPVSAEPADPEQVLAWRSGRVIFDAKPFADALTELGRYVPERIVLANRSRSQDAVSGVFSIRQASAAIEALSQTQGLTARRIPGVMILIS